MKSNIILFSLFLMSINFYASQNSRCDLTTSVAGGSAVASLLRMLQYDFKKIQADMINQNNIQIYVADQLRDIASSEREKLIFKERDDRKEIILSQAFDIGVIMGCMWILRGGEASSSLAEEVRRVSLIQQNIWL